MKTQLKDGRMAEVVCPKQKSRADKIAFIFLMCCGLFITSAMYSNEHYPQIVETAHAEEVEEFTHYVVEYYKGGVRHVGVIEKKLLKLISGTASDHGINPNHLLAISFMEGVEYHSGYTFLASPTATGDGGRAVGAFQILYRMHGVSEEDARHPYFSARFTSEMLLNHGYKQNQKYAIQRHNSGNAIGIPYANKAWEIAGSMKIIDKETI